MDWERAAINVSQGLPSEIIKVMSSLATVFGDKCYLGGGAVRDLLLGSKEFIKDWDFYFPIHLSEVHKTSMASTLSAILKPIRVWYNWPEKDPSYDESSFLVLKGHNLGTDFDFIFSGQEIEDFDHAICQCSLNCKTFELKTTKHFDRTVEYHLHRIFYNNLNAHTLNKSIGDHTKRILKKYPWPVLIDYEWKKSHVTY